MIPIASGVTRRADRYLWDGWWRRGPRSIFRRLRPSLLVVRAHSHCEARKPFVHVPERERRRPRGTSDVRIELSPEEMARVLEEAGIVFMFAPLLHPAMRHVGPVRRELGFPTIMNVLGPLTNPARVRRQLVGVADPGSGSLSSSRR